MQAREILTPSGWFDPRESWLSRVSDCLGPSLYLAHFRDSVSRKSETSGRTRSPGIVLAKLHGMPSEVLEISINFICVADGDTMFDRPSAGRIKSRSIFATREKVLSSPLPEPKLSRKERELQFRINLVLDAAEEVFAESSYADASVEVIAQRAEISIGTLYNLFHSKEDIYRAVVSRAQENFFAQIVTQVASARGPRDQVRVLVSYFFEHFSRYNRQFRHYVAASNGFQWELKSQLEHEALDAQTKFMKRVVEICERGMESGVFKKTGLSAELMAVTLLGIPHSFLMVWLDKQGIDLMSLVPQALVAADRVTGVEVD